jgi:D-alanyl-D-alanine carboxypeptidase
MIFDKAVLLGRLFRFCILMAAVSLFAAWVMVGSAHAAPYAAHLMDARTGETLYQENAETRLHPASLTKMMTLYIAFQEIERGNLSLDTMITVSKNAAAQPPSRLGLKAGQKLQLRYLIRAAAIKSANDAAQAIGDAIGGNQEQFAQRMTLTAKALGMKNTTFKNANGLTAKGHLSTAKDMSVLGRHLFYDFPQYYNIFSRRSTDAGLATVANTNRKFLDAYKGADGIKTGFTQPAGFNLTASAERNGVRLIATVFGGVSTPDRNARISKLLDKGFAMVKGGKDAPSPILPNADDELMARAAAPDLDDTMQGAPRAAKTLRVVMTLKTSPRPMQRPDMTDIIDGAETLVASLADDIAGALAEATGGNVIDTVATTAPLPFALIDGAEPSLDLPSLATRRPAPKPDALRAQVAAISPTAPEVVAQLADPVAAPQTIQDGPAAQPEIAALPDLAEQPNLAEQPEIVSQPNQVAVQSPAKPVRNAPIFDANPPIEDLNLASNTATKPTALEVVTRISTSGANHYGINVGRYRSADSAERILLKTQLVESATLAGSLRKVTQKGGGYDANFLGLSQESAELACRRLMARSITCITLGP